MRCLVHALTTAAKRLSACAHVWGITSTIRQLIYRARCLPALPACLQVDNQSKVDLANVQLSLEQCASVRFRNIMGPDSSIEIKRVVAQHDWEGVAKGSSRLGGKALQAALPIPAYLDASTRSGQVRGATCTHSVLRLHPLLDAY